MTIRRLLTILFCALMVACASDDGPSGPIVGGPTNDDDDGGGSSGGNDNPFTYTATANLKDLAGFPIGNIVSAGKLSSSSTENQAFRELLNTEFNSITAENDMKMANIFQGAGSYDFSDGDAIVAYAKANGHRVHGHALIWHQSIPNWLLNFSGTDAEFEVLIENYIKATVAHFAEEKMTVNGNEVSVVASWDVVNEAFETQATNASFFRTRLGSDYVAKCFTWAREADADVKLFYNDFNIAGQPAKRNQVLNMVNNFLNNDTPIDGIGMQMHLNHDWPTNDLPTSIQQIANTGLLVHISELDVKVNYDNSLTELTLPRAQAQETQYQSAAYYYTELVPEAQQFGITIWGFRDRDSWLYDGGSDWPLLFDNDFSHKLAHRGIAAGLSSESPE